MADFNFINFRLAVGAAVQGNPDVRALIIAGITHVVNCQAEFDDTTEFSNLPVSVLWIGVADDGQPKPVEWFEKGITFALNALMQPHTKVYFHCAAGVNRGPSMAYAVLRALGFTAGQAMALLRSARPQVGVAYAHDADIAVSQLGYV